LGGKGHCSSKGNGPNQCAQQKPSGVPDRFAVCLFQGVLNLDAATFTRTGGRNNSHFGDARVNRAHLLLTTA